MKKFVRMLIYCCIITFYSLTLIACQQAEEDINTASNIGLQTETPEFTNNYTTLPEDIPIIAGDCSFTLPVAFSDWDYPVEIVDPILISRYGSLLSHDPTITDEAEDCGVYIADLSYKNEIIGSCSIVTKTDDYEDGILYDVMLIECDDYSIGEFTVGQIHQDAEAEDTRWTDGHMYYYQSDSVHFKVVTGTDDRIDSIAYNVWWKEIYE